MSEAILQVTNLVKKIKGKTILDHVSFEVGQGDCLALIGPNGAGKTTLMSCILGDKKASSGQVFIKGKKGKAQDQIAVLLQENTIPSQLKVKELIAFFQDISENGLSKVESALTIQRRSVSAVCGQTLRGTKTSSCFCSLSNWQA